MTTKNHPILSAFGREDMADTYNPEKHKIIVQSADGTMIGEIVPRNAANRTHETAYTRFGASIGPSFDPSIMRARLIRAMFDGDEAAFKVATLHRVPRF